MTGVSEWTREALLGLPRRERFDRDPGPFTSLVIIPDDDGDELHDSGYRCMTYALCRGGIPFLLVGGCSDVLHVGGLDGRQLFGSVNGSAAPRVRWAIDALPVSGYLHLFVRDPHCLRITHDVSSMEVFVERRETT